VEFIEVLAPMAGITNGTFCRDLSSYGFDMVTLGGYNADHPTMEAGHKILARGRPEFEVAEEEFQTHLEEQTALIKDQDDWEGMVSVNLRSTSPTPIIQISKLSDVDVVEINAHCRQPEITELGCGQALMKNPKYLEQFTNEVVRKANSKVSVKIRVNVLGIHDIDVAKAVESAGADYIHVDAMKPGFDCADYDKIKYLKKEISMFLIGNNSIKDIQSARYMIDAGADGISIARAAIGGKIPFDLSQI
jgi:TIM-barrel protein